jgi:hypothetical protein
MPTLRRYWLGVRTSGYWHKSAAEPDARVLATSLPQFFLVGVSPHFALNRQQPASGGAACPAVLPARLTSPPHRKVRQTQLLAPHDTPGVAFAVPVSAGLQGAGDAVSLFH